MKTWFQSKITESDVNSHSDIIRPLAMRRADLLCRRLVTEKQYALAEVVSKLEDSTFRHLYMPSENFPTQFQLLLVEHLDCIK